MTNTFEKYQMLRRIYRERIFRYLVAAGSAFFVDFCVYNFCVYVVFDDFSRPFLGLEVTSHFVSLSISFVFGIITNFLISKHLVFSESDLRTRTQFTRFLLIALLVFLANYWFMVFLIWSLDLPNYAARFIAGACIAVLSYLSHKLFSFRVNPEKLESDQAGH